MGPASPASVAVTRTRGVWEGTAWASTVLSQAKGEQKATEGSLRIQ